MEDLPTTVAPSAPENLVPQPAPETAPVPAPRRRLRLILLLPLLIAVLGMVVVWLAASRGGSPFTSTQGPGPATPMATPTPERALSPVASQSAFLALEAHVASLSSAINNFILTDPILSPPVLELPLGF